MIDQLKDLKDTYESARQQIDRGKEPLEDLIKLQNFLLAIHSDPKANFLEKFDKDFKRYFFDDFSTGLLKRLTRERSRDDKYLDVIGSILKSFMFIFLDFLKLGVYNQQFFDSIKFLFEFDSILHNYNYQIPEEQLKMLRSANQDWRKDLKEGDMIDAIADESNLRCSGWSQARISSVNGDALQLEYIFDVKSVDRYLDRWSVEVAPYLSKTKESWEWRSTLAVNQVVDAHDKQVWNKSTILEIKETQISPNRVVKMAYIGYRIYTENGTKSDEKGNFEGWSGKFDEWISLYSPKIQPFMTKSQKGESIDVDLDEDMDSQITPEEGFSRVYAVPRIRKCISSVFLHIINLFGNEGGFNIVLNLLQSNSEDLQQEEGLFDLNVLASIVHCISYSYIIYHKEFIQEYGPKFVDLCIKRLRDAPEKQLRDVRREKIESIIKSIDNFQRRLIGKEEREKQTEILKLEVSLMCLKSSYLERRIQGIRDLNQIIKNQRMYSANKNFTSQFLIEWMQSNGVFNILFDTKKTHLQLVQRTSDILKLLLQDNMLTQELLEMFWSLAKSEYKFEIYKIINECSFYLKQEHIDFFFKEIKQIPGEKLAIEEFQCLSELGKFAKDDLFKVSVSEFFWNLICNSDNVKEDLVASCITKFCEMVKNWDLQRKHGFFQDLTKNLSQNKSSIPSLRLFKGLIKDQKDKTSYNNYGSSPLRTGAVQSEQPTQSEMTLIDSLKSLISENQLVSVLIENLREYSRQARAKLQAGTAVNEARKKCYLVNPKYSHHEEIDERLQFIKYLASVSPDYQVSKNDLDAIYDMTVQNALHPSDPEEFLLWCKASCEQSTQYNQILDLNEVGQFFTEKMQSGDLDVKNLLVVGFDFLQQYFISVNESQQKILKFQPKQNKMKSYSYTIGYGYNAQGVYGPKLPNYYGGYGPNKKQDEEESPSQLFKLITKPSELDQLEIVWSMALNCQNPKVVPKAIDFLIKVYYSLDEELDTLNKAEIQEQLIEKCMQILRETTEEQTITRVIEIIKNILYETEKKGTGDVRPHNALLKGELLEKIIIKNKASPKGQNLNISIYSNATVWDFKKQVALALDLAPKYLKLERVFGYSTFQTIKENENGKTLAQLGLQSGETITAYKIQIEEEVVNAPLTGPDGQLTDRAKQIFNEWFDLYSENGQMTKETCSLFIKGCTGEQPSANDDRISNLFKMYDTNNDGFIKREGFLLFYQISSKNKPETVRENLRSHNIRNDLKKLSELTEESTFQTEDMPRFRISRNQEQFDLLISLLDRQDKVSEASWDLIQMLATNQELYKRVLGLKTALDPESGRIDWTKFFDSQSVYKLLYTLQIVEAVMEEGEDEGREVITIEEDVKKKVPQAPPLPGATPIPTETETQGEVTQSQQEEKQPENAPLTLARRSSVIIESQEEDRKLKSEWTKMFLQHNGFGHILEVFMNKQINEQTTTAFDLKHIAFLLKLLRIFIMASFSTNSESQSIFADTLLIRRSSSTFDQNENTAASNDPKTGSENESSTRFKELQKQLTGPIGEAIINQIDYNALQKKILDSISKILVRTQQKSGMTFEEKLIVENALSLWVGCALHKNELFEDFLQSVNPDDFVLQGLLFCKQEKVREEFKQSLGVLSHKIINEDGEKTPLLYLLKLLSSNFSIISQYHCKQYFELFCDLIDHYFKLKNFGGVAKEQQVFNPETLLSLIIDKIKEFNNLQGQTPQSVETDGSKAGPISDVIEDNDSSKVSEQEEIYIGLIQLTGKIIDNFDISFSEKIVEQKNLIDEIFVQFLFSSVFKQHDQTSTGETTVKVKPKRNQKQQEKKQTFGKKSKDAAYKLLNSLIRKSPLLMNQFLSNSMLPLMQLIKRHDGWNYTPPGSSELKQKYVGLRNLGCICYMNSMLQQFFMIPAFRYGLLSVDDKLPEDLVEFKGQRIDDNVLHQLQKLIAHLELSERSDFNPFEFCFAFKDLDGMPTNISEQKDAQEFLNLAVDRIENLLRTTRMKYLLLSVLGGQTCSQLVCQECGKVKNRIEDFYNLSLTVKDTKSMADSLQKLIDGEVINDYECDNCKKKVDISKRMLISQAPNVLIVHLQRIIFNFDTFRNDKINSFFEFPQHLDLKPYSFYEVMKKENRLGKKNKDDADEGEQQQQQQDEDQQWPEEENCFEYKLVGVNVHSGTANAGHYWSFINTRRGGLEPDENDPDWEKTENDPWMKFNDSAVTDYNFEKLKEDCYGGDGKNGETGGDSWSFGGSYGQSAYMLIYEKRQKRPLKILATPEEIAQNKDQFIHDPKKDEYYKMVDYRNAVEDIAPNAIYKQVFEDNYKFEFENDIYSNEFFDFVKGIISAVLTLDKDRQNQGELLNQAKTQMISVAKKTILELLAKCFYNSSIKQLVESLIEVLDRDDSLCIQFLEQSYKEDQWSYLFEILLECTDSTARQHVGNLVKFILIRLKYIEKDRLADTEDILNENGEKIGDRFVALSSRFIIKSISLLNTQVAKNWGRFDSFLEILYVFAVGQDAPAKQSSVNEAVEEDETGLEFLFKLKFVEKACDFILGKKSPLVQIGEKRHEMGGSFSTPNFTPIIRLVIKMVSHERLTQKYPLTDLEKKMFLHIDLLKVMLGANGFSKQVGQCLSNMCKNNSKVSQKVSKVFIKAFNGSTSGNFQNYLKALKPFLRIDDDLKLQRLEWVFGFGQLVNRKNYREEKYKYGIEFVDRINEEAYTFVCPISSSDESLFQQLLKCKGKLDTNCISCLQEMLSLMAKDDVIARFVYTSAPPSYQSSRFTDWIRPYLEIQRAETERSHSYNSYFKSKFDSIMKSLKHLEQFEEKVQVFKEEERAAYENAKAQEGEQFTQQVEQDWLSYKNNDVLSHFPPQVVIGRQVGEDRVVLDYDEDANVRVTVYEIVNEYNYSNPTGFFNISLPHIEAKTSMYQTMSYAQYKKMLIEKERKTIEEAKVKEESEVEAEPQLVDPQEEPQASANTQQEPEPVQDEIITRNWFQDRKEGPSLLKVTISNKTSETLSVSVSLSHDDSTGETCNIKLPSSAIKEASLFQSDKKVLINLEKIFQHKAFSNLKVKVNSKLKKISVNTVNANVGATGQDTVSTYTPQEHGGYYGSYDYNM